MVYHFGDAVGVVVCRASVHIEFREIGGSSHVVVSRPVHLQWLGMEMLAPQSVGASNHISQLIQV